MDFSFSSRSLVIFYIALDKHKFLFPPKKKRKKKNPFLTCEFNEAAAATAISLRMTKKLFLRRKYLKTFESDANIKVSWKRQ